MKNKKLILPLLLIALCIVILLIILIPRLTADKPIDTAKIEIFLTKLYTVDATAIEGMADPAADYPKYLSDTIGDLTTQEVQDGLLDSRFPFSLTESIAANAVKVSPLKAENRGENRFEFSVETGAKTYTGTLTFDPGAGKIVAFEPNLP